jgi:hypothetical protein
MGLWLGICSIFIQNLMPEEVFMSRCWFFRLMRAGVYNVHVLIRDPQGYRSPLLLAIEQAGR